MERERMLLDYVLSEASGDSEAECFGAAAEAESGAAEDDAQSCSCGSLSDYAVADAGGDDSRGAEFDGWGVEEEGEDGGCACEEEDGVVDQCCGGGKVVPAAATEKLSKSKGREESDRLFWETCLASEKS